MVNTRAGGAPADAEGNTGMPSHWEPWAWKLPYPSSSGLLSCRWVRFHPRRASTPETHICVRTYHDLVSDVISNQGRWAECDDLSTLFSSFARRSDELIVDIGANIGACTLGLLLETEARLIALEPGPDNLFYLTSSLLALREMLPKVAQRARLYPLAMGDARRVEVLHAERGNAGHSVIGPPIKNARFARGGWEAAQEIYVGTLDEVLWPRAHRLRNETWSPPSVAMLKLDVEGYECNALRGMRALFCARAVRSMAVEIFDNALRQQGCSGISLQQMLVDAGFVLYLKPPRRVRSWRRSSPHPQPFDARVLHRTEPYNVYAVLSELVVTPELNSTDSRQPRQHPSELASHHPRAPRRPGLGRCRDL